MIPSKSGSMTFLDTFLCLHRGEATPWPQALSNATLGNLKSLTFEDIPFIALLGLQGCRVLQTDWRLSPHTLEHISSPSVSQDETQCGHILEPFWTWFELECSNDEPVISCKELGTLKNPAILEDPPMSTNKDMVDFLCYPSSIVIPSPAVYRWSLIPGTRDSQSSGSCKIQKERAVVIPGTMGANTYLIASPFSACDSIKVAQDNDCITQDRGLPQAFPCILHTGRQTPCSLHLTLVLCALKIHHSPTSFS